VVSTLIGNVAFHATALHILCSVEPDFVLLDELLRLEVLTHREYDDVRSKETAAHRSDISGPV